MSVPHTTQIIIVSGHRLDWRGQSWRFSGDSESDFVTILQPRIAIKIAPTLTTPSKKAIMAAIMIPIMNTIMGWGRIACQNRDYWDISGSRAAYAILLDYGIIAILEPESLSKSFS